MTSAEELMDDVCLNILKALDGRALSLEELANEVSDGNTNILYRRGLKVKLMASGRVSHTKAIGYFRPDAPPLDRMLKVPKVRGK